MKAEIRAQFEKFLFILSFLIVFGFAACASAAVINVHFNKAVRSSPATGRLTVFLIRGDSKIPANTEPAGQFFFTDPQPIYGIDVKNLKQGQVVAINDSATAFPVKLSELPAGQYRAQAVLRVNRESGDWRKEPGNLYSGVANFTVRDEKTRLDVALNKMVLPRPIPKMQGVEIVDIESKLLSKFRGRSVRLRAGVIWPLNVQPGRDYPAVYVIPGFGGDHFGAFARKEAIDKSAADSAQRAFARNAFWIVLDPDGPNGHTLFADSEVNGPCGAALIQELIPALEARFPLSRQAAGRILYGHSSGGWSSLWLAINYPHTFSACWTYSPDPVDFHRLERVNIYDRDNAYIDRDSTPGHKFDASSFRINGKSVCTVRIENLMEQAVGPDNSSAGQWDSWQAVWGHRDAAGNPVALFDPISGKINHAEADYYKQRDITEMLRKNPERVGQILQQRVRLIVGSMDEFYLNEAVGFLKSTLEGLKIQTPPQEHFGYIHIIPGAGHGSILHTPEALNFYNEAATYLRRNNYWQN